MAKDKILIVEDEIVTAEDIASSLKQLGYAVPAIVTSGEEALKVAEETRPNLVVLDIGLDGDLDGVTTAEEIRSRWDIPVIFLTAHSDAQTLERAKRTCPDGYILKPFQEKDLLVNIEVALYRHEAKILQREKQNLLDPSHKRLEMVEAHSQSQTKNTRILIVDEHPIIRHGLSEIIAKESDLCICGEAQEGFAALDDIAVLQPDFIVVDISLKDMNGLRWITAVKSDYPALPMLVLSSHNETIYAQRALRAGAEGYLMKQEEPQKIVLAIRKIMNGDIYVSEKIQSMIVARFQSSGRNQTETEDTDKLTDRELEVFQLIGKGGKTSQIAAELHLSIKTIETYRANIKKKLNLKDATELLQRAIEWNLIQDIT